MPRPAVFITDDFLLDTPAARRLYHDHAARMPIVDYHCHLPSDEIAGDRRFANLAQIWLHGDHYKWRAMRADGVPERFCTGDATDREKFARWADTVPRTLRNPLYHWTHLELKRPFGIADRLLSPATEQSIWDDCNRLLAQPGFTVRGIMTRMDVRVVCTTDDPVDTLEHHLALKREQDAGGAFTVQMRPTWRPDKGMAVDEPVAFNAWVDRLSTVSGVAVRDPDSYLAALKQRHDSFHVAGCRLSDHGIDTVYADDYTLAGIRSIFAKLRRGERPDAVESAQFKSFMLYEGALMDHAQGWVQQFHIGALRNNNSRLFAALGPDKGFDSIDDQPYARPLARFLDRLDRDDRLARTILYNLNPRDNEMLAAMVGNYQDGSVAGKMQFGSAWWFLDQKDGMTRQIEALSNLGLLARFVGMLTDSRSFLSYTRHEYFRRTLCGLLGREIAAGVIPNDLALVGGLVRDVCYRNAARYFDFALDAQDTVTPAQPSKPAKATTGAKPTAVKRSRRR